MRAKVNNHKESWTSNELYAILLRLVEDHPEFYKYDYMFNFSSNSFNKEDLSWRLGRTEQAITTVWYRMRKWNKYRIDGRSSFGQACKLVFNNMDKMVDILLKKEIIHQYEMARKYNPLLIKQFEKGGKHVLSWLYELCYKYYKKSLSINTLEDRDSDLIHKLEELWLLYRQLDSKLFNHIDGRDLEILKDSVFQQFNSIATEFFVFKEETFDDYHNFVNKTVF